MRSPSLYRGNYSSPKVRNNRSIRSGSLSRPTTRSNAKAPSRNLGSSRNSGLGQPGRVSGASPLKKTPGFNGFQTSTNGRAFKPASHYRAQLDRKMEGSSAGLNKGVGGVGKAGGALPGKSEKTGKALPGKFEKAGKISSKSVDGYDHDGKLHVNAYVGGYGFGLGFGYYDHHHHCHPYWHHHGYFWNHCWGSRWFHRHWWYPWHNHCWYPFYWSYRYFPYYRTVYTNHYVTTHYTDDGYYAGAGYESDPYVEDDFYYGDGAASLAPEGGIESAPKMSGGEGPFSKPLKTGVDAGADYASAIAFGDAAIKRGEALVAAEAYRQAWQMSKNPAALHRLTLALLVVGDYGMASKAMVLGVAGGEKSVLDLSVASGEVLDASAMRHGLASLERYLVENPNDEASNLLLGALYVMNGKDYAAFMLLSRLKEADYEPRVCDLFLARAKAGLAEEAK